MKNFLIAIAISIGISACMFALAQPLDSLTYPVGPLGGCASKQACKAYCDNPQNIPACIDFAEQHQLISKEEAKMGRKFSQMGVNGPGGCVNMNQCKAYCDNINHIEECISFAEQSGIISKAEIKEAKQVLKAVKKGVQMPGGCTSKANCDAYCSNPQHIEECMAFGIAAGFVSKKEQEEMQRILPIMKAGGMPGGCTSKASCDAYCDVPAHASECADFALKAGFITAEEAEMMKKTGGVGPGGCRRDECDNYCNNPANSQVCFEFGMKYGMIPEKDLQEMRGHLAEMQKSLNEAPEEVAACLINALGADVVAKIQAGDITAIMGPDMGKVMEPCWRAWQEQERARMEEQEAIWEQQRRENEEQGWGEPPEGGWPEGPPSDSIDHPQGPPPDGGVDFQPPEDEHYPMAPEEPPTEKPQQKQSSGNTCGDTDCMPGYYCVDSGTGRCCPNGTTYSITEGTCN